MRTLKQKLLGGTAFARFARFGEWPKFRADFAFGVVSLHLWPQGGPFPPEHKEIRDHALRIIQKSRREREVPDVQASVGR